MSGDDDLDKPFHGNEIEGHGTAFIDGEKKMDIEILSAEVYRGE